MSKKTDILVTGGAGFIGSNLCEKLVENKNNKVYSLDNYSSGIVQNHIEGVQYIDGESSKIEKLIDFSPKYIYHLGEYSGIEQSFEDVNLVWEYNKKSIFPILEFVKKTNSKLIYTGSTTKFEGNGQGRNQSPYAYSKASNADLIMNYGKWFKINYAIVYLSNVYGKGEIFERKISTVINLFVKQYLNGIDLSVVKPGTQRRNFTHIDDIINGVILVGEKGSGDNYCIGNPESYSIIEIAKMFNSKIKYIDERKGDRLIPSIDISKTQKLGWKPEISLKSFIKEIINSRKINV